MIKRFVIKLQFKGHENDKARVLKHLEVIENFKLNVSFDCNFSLGWNETGWLLKAEGKKNMSLLIEYMNEFFNEKALAMDVKCWYE